MTEDEAVYCLKADSESHSEVCEECDLYGVVGCDHCENDAIEIAIKALEEVQQYRAIGTPEECRAAMEKQNVNKELESHDEKHILECCISLMQELFLLGTNHSGGTSTRAKCEQLGVDSSEEIEFDWSDEE